MTAIDEYAATFAEEPGYLNWAAYGPMSPVARTALHEAAATLSTGRAADVAAATDLATGAQNAVAALLGADPEEVTLHPSSTHALQQALAGIDGEVIAAGAEFPSVTITLARAAAAASSGRLAPRWISPPAARVTPDAVAAAL
ncbi:MAG: aminotransferase, partial [Actinobacteria bacterium]|nr:aminotransferase [Actinomycetota bacterium]